LDCRYFSVSAFSPALAIPGAAFDSVDFSQFSLPFGEVLRGIHHYSWNLLLIVMGLHVGRAFVFGAYKPPREMLWVSGVLLLLVVPLFAVTGDLLPWNQKGYWSTQVRLSIIASVPLVGEAIVRVLQGGPMTGIVALTRFYALHILFLPFAFLCLVAVHFHFISQRGLSEPLSSKPATRKTVPFFPIIVNRWLILFLLTTLILGLVARQWPADLGDPADPTDSAYVPKPEWWGLFLNQLVSLFRGPFSVIGTVVIPIGLAALMIALPFLDRKAERRPLRRSRVMLPAFIILSFLIGLSVMGYVEHFGVKGK